MTFEEREAARPKRTVQEFLDGRRPPAEIRDELDYGYQIDLDDQSVEVHEIRADRQDPDETMKTPVAKVKYVRRRDIWKLYCIRRDGDWHKYEPLEEVGSLEEALEVVDEDEYHSFWG